MLRGFSAHLPGDVGSFFEMSVQGFVIRKCHCKGFKLIFSWNTLAKVVQFDEEVSKKELSVEMSV